MSTPTTLAEDGGPLVLYDHDPDTPQLPQRTLYLTNGLNRWLEEVVSHELPDHPDNLPPVEQVVSIMGLYCGGSPLAYDVDVKVLDPIGHFVWELKTEDVRIFGWFYQPKVFIAAFGELKRRLSATKRSEINKLYQPFINCTVQTRNLIDLDPPKFVKKVALNAVL